MPASKDAQLTDAELIRAESYSPKSGQNFTLERRIATAAADKAADVTRRQERAAATHLMAVLETIASGDWDRTYCVLAARTALREHRAHVAEAGGGETCDCDCHADPYFTGRGCCEEQHRQPDAAAGGPGQCDCWYVYDRNEGRSGTIQRRPDPACAKCGGTGERP